MKIDKSKIVYQPPNHLAGGLRVGPGLRLTVTVLGRPWTSPETGSTSSSVTISTAVVRGLSVEEEEDTAWGVGNAARRVLAGAGTVTVWVAVTVRVSVSYDVSETINGGSSWNYG
jgi:hypothetical protein